MIGQKREKGFIVIWWGDLVSFLRISNRIQNGGWPGTYADCLPRLQKHCSIVFGSLAWEKGFQWGILVEWGFGFPAWVEDHLYTRFLTSIGTSGGYKSILRLRSIREGEPMRWPLSISSKGKFWVEKVPPKGFEGLFHRRRTCWKILFIEERVRSFVIFIQVLVLVGVACGDRSYDICRGGDLVIAESY